MGLMTPWEAGRSTSPASTRRARSVSQQRCASNEVNTVARNLYVRNFASRGAGRPPTLPILYANPPHHTQTLLPRSFVRPRLDISSPRTHVRRAGAPRRHLRGRSSFPFPAGRLEIGLRRRLPSWRGNWPLSACAKSHGARLLADQTRRVGLCGLSSTCSASHQVDAVTNTPRLLEIESTRRRVHPALEILDGIGHHHTTRRCNLRRHCAPFRWFNANYG